MTEREERETRESERARARERERQRERENAQLCKLSSYSPAAGLYPAPNASVFDTANSNSCDNLVDDMVTADTMESDSVHTETNMNRLRLDF